MNKEKNTKIDNKRSTREKKEALLIEAKALADLNSKLRTKKQRLAIRLA